MIRPRSSLPVLGIAVAGSLLLPNATPTVSAGERGSGRTLSVTAQTEIVRRQNAAVGADEAILRGDSAMIRQDYEQASKEYRSAVDALNEAPATSERRTIAVKKFYNATMKLAEQRIVEGRYLDAEATAKIILRPEYDPGYGPALTMLKHLEDPTYYNQTITPKFIDKVAQVKQLFNEAQGYFDSARYDLAFKRYEQILALDPTNIAARRGEERVDVARQRYADPAAYDESRARAIWEVSKGWERPVRKFGIDADPHKGVKTLRDDSGTVAISRKLAAITIPNIEFRATTIRDAIEFLRQESRRLDTTEENPDNRGVNIFLKLPPAGTVARPVAAAGTPDAAAIPGVDPATAAAAPAGPVASAETRITLTLSRIPLLEALRYVASQAGLKVKVEPYAVSIVPLTELTDALITAEFRVPPTFIGTTSSGGTSNALNQGATSATATGGGGTVDNTGTGSGNTITRQEAKAFLEASGVTFPPGASATYLPATSKLVVRNTQENIDLIENLVQSTETIIRQVEIESKFVEINQTNVKELSFDVGIGQQNFGPSKKVFIGGGTDPSATSNTGFSNPDGSPVGGSPITAGTRSGSFAISANAIDALLFGSGAAAAAPGIFSVAGVFTDPQFQVVVRALNQSKGVDLLSAPRVTTKSGQKATIEIIREFLYPTQFQPPQIPQNFGNNNGISGGVINPITGLLTGGGSSGAFPVTPTTPTSFEKRNTGVTLEVEPVIGPDNFTIDLNLQPQVVDFEGFINYGSPIQTVSSNPLGMSAPVVLTPNVINQPIFSTRKVSTSVSVYDGSTVVLGGLVREDIQKVNDKVPVFGDIPLVGRLFRSKVDQNIKRNLIIFVTARLIDPSGQPLLNTEEEEEVVQPLVGPDAVIPPGPLPLFPKK